MYNASVYYDRALSIACPDMHPALRRTSVLDAFTKGIPFPKLMDLTRPGRV